MHHRLRTTIKWTSTTLTVLLLAVWIGSAWLSIEFSPRPTIGVHFSAGQVTLRISEYDPPSAASGDRDLVAVRRHSFMFRWWFSRSQVIVGRMWSVQTTEFDVPLWLVLLIPLLPTSLSCFHHRRHTPGHCPACNYNLHANTTGVCPECGAWMSEQV